MIDRGFTEIDLRHMLEHGERIRRGAVPGRWVVVTRHRRRVWEVIVEPDFAARLLVVVTAYAVWEP